jgi:flagellin-like hook-associated protein FlgL
LEVQDGMLDSVGKIIDRMSELKVLASQDPMKSAQDRASYNNEFKDLQIQLYDISKMEFNGVSLFANQRTDVNGEIITSSPETIFNAQNQALSMDNTLTIYTSGDGSSGSKVSVHKSLLLSALTVGSDKSIGHKWSDADNATASISGSNIQVTFASEGVGGTLSLGQISVGVISQALENISYLRSQNGGVHSRLAFNLESLGQQKTNMRAALGRIVDVDIAEESMNLAKYTILNQAAASMLAQANASSDVALMLLR